MKLWDPGYDLPPKLGPSGGLRRKDLLGAAGKKGCLQEEGRKAVLLFFPAAALSVLFPLAPILPPPSPGYPASRKGSRRKGYTESKEPLHIPYHGSSSTHACGVDIIAFPHFLIRKGSSESYVMYLGSPGLQGAEAAPKPRYLTSSPEVSSISPGCTTSCP